MKGDRVSVACAAGVDDVVVGCRTAVIDGKCACAAVEVVNLIASFAIQHDRTAAIGIAVEDIVGAAAQENVNRFAGVRHCSFRTEDDHVGVGKSRVAKRDGDDRSDRGEIECVAAAASIGDGVSTISRNKDEAIIARAAFECVVTRTSVQFIVTIIAV